MVAAVARQRYKIPHPPLSTFIAASNSELPICNTIIFYNLQPAHKPISGFWERYTMFKCINPEPRVRRACALTRSTSTIRFFFSSCTPGARGVDAVRLAPANARRSGRARPGLRRCAARRSREPIRPYGPSTIRHRFRHMHSWSAARPTIAFRLKLLYYEKPSRHKRLRKRPHRGCRPSARRR